MARQQESKGKYLKASADHLTAAREEISTNQPEIKFYVGAITQITSLKRERRMRGIKTNQV
jgi:hypothetical protein